ncbi:hypothetical protein [Streptomyces sp. x-19]
MDILDHHDGTAPPRSPQAPFGYALRPVTVALADLLPTTREPERP